MRHAAHRGAIVSAFLAASLTACQSTGVGEAFDSIFTSDTSATPAAAAGPELTAPSEVGTGKVVGGIEKSEIARSLDPADLEAAAQAEYFALEATAGGAEHAWSGPGGASGVIVPGEVYEIKTTRCRDYTHTVTIKGKPHSLRGTACRREDKIWRSVNS